MKKILKILSLCSLLFLLTTGSIFATYTSNTIDLDTTNNLSFQNNTLTVDGTATLSQSIILGVTKVTGEEVSGINDTTIKRINLNGGTLSFTQKGGTLNGGGYYHPLSNGSNAEPLATHYDASAGFGIIIDGTVAEMGNITGSPVYSNNGNGTINIVTGGTGSEICGLIAVVGDQNTKTNPSVSQNPNISLTGVNLNASLSQGQYDNHTGDVGSLGFGVAVTGNANVNLNCNVTGCPAVFGAFKQGTPPNNANGTTTININGGSYETYSTGKTQYPFGAVRNYGNDTGVVNINVNGGDINGKGVGPGIYSANSVSNIKINENPGPTSISGTSGIVARSGNITVTDGTISGNSTTPGNNSGLGSASGNGSAICIDATKGSATGESLTLNLDGGIYNSTASNQPAVGYQTGGGGDNLLTDINVTGGEFNSGSSNVFDLGVPKAGESVAQNFVSGGTFSNSLDPDQLASSVGAQTTVTLKNGEKAVIYAKTPQQAEQAAKDYAQQQGSPIASTSTIPISSKGEYDIPTPSTPSSGSGIFNLNLGDTLLNYYNVSNNASEVVQTENIGLTMNSTGSNNYAANALEWSITPLSGSGNTITFNTDWTSLYYPEGSNQYAIQTKSTDSNGSWTLVQQINYKLGTDGKPVVNNQNQPTTINSLGQTYLIYNGKGNMPNGIYQLTATAPTTYTYNNKTLTDSIRLSISTSSIESVTVTQNGTTAPYYQSIDMQTTPTVQFGYNTTPASSYPGSNVTWNLTTNTDDSASPYASINPTTGLLRFRAPTPPGTILYVSVEVDGITSNSIAIAVTGEPVSTDITEMAFVPNTVNVVNTGSFDLMSNLYTLPDYNLVTPEMLEDIQFTSDSNNVIIYNGTILPINTNFTGTAEVTAVYTNEDGTKTEPTTLTVNFVSKEVPATGIAAKESLTFSLTDDQPQNVGAYLTPETTTDVVPLADFNYDSSDDSIATVDENGNVYPVSPGTTTVITTYDGELANPAPNVEPTDTVTTTITVTETPSVVPATGITCSPEGPIYLAPSTVANAKSSETITASVEPENSTDKLNVTISPETVATLTDNEDGTWTVNAVSDGRATVTLQAGDITETINVIVSSQPVVTSGITASGTTPDEFTVTVNNVIANPALNAANATISNVSIFTWSGPDQVDRQCKAVPTAEAVNGTYSYSPFLVNGNEANTWYFNADSIYVECYAYLSSGNTVYLGGVTPNYSWVDATDTAGHNVAYITYQENIGFVEPTVFDGNQSGLTGRHLQLEGLRVSSCIEGVDVVTDVHEQNIGWVEGKEDGSYAGTQHENRQIEAIRLRLTGENASNYDIYYQVHAEDIGWTGPVTGNQIAGTVGQNRQIESVQIQIVPKGTSATGWATN